MPSTATTSSTTTTQNVLARLIFMPVYVQSKMRTLYAKEFLAEFIGTFMLIAVGDGAIASFLLKGQGSPVDVFSVCFCFGVGALIGITASSTISGGHINPAFTVAFAVIKRFSWKKIWHYLLAQYLGGFTAAAVVYWTYYEAINSYDGGVRSAYLNKTTSTGQIFATYPGGDYVTPMTAFVDQLVGTAVLAFAVMAIGDDKNETPKGLRPMVLSLVITGVCVGFNINCGAILNPARDVAPRLFTVVAGYGWEAFQPIGGHYWWIAGLIGPHLGAILGCWIYLFTVDQQNLFHESAKMVMVEVPEKSGRHSVNGCAIKESHMDEKLHTISVPKLTVE